MGTLEVSLPCTGRISVSGALGRTRGLTPGPGRHPGGAVRLLVLPDVILLVVVEGLDAVAAAGLKQSCAGLRARAATQLHGRPERLSRASGWQDGARAPRSSPAPHYCPAGTASPAPPAREEQGTHAVLVRVDAEVDLRDPIERSTVATRAGLSTGLPGPRGLPLAPLGDASRSCPSQGSTVESKGVDGSAGSDRPHGCRQMGGLGRRGQRSIRLPPRPHVPGPLRPRSAQGQPDTPEGV